MAAVNFEEIIAKAVKGTALTTEEIVELLSIEEPAQMEKLFRAARKVRENVFGSKVFLYGFVYFSTWCRNDCNFCYYRRSNPIERYRKDMDEVFDVAKRLSVSGVHLIDLTMGEDVVFHRENFKSLVRLIRKIKKETQLPVMISPGVVEKEHIDQFAQEGVEWYALYQETHNRDLFKKLRLHQDYDKRMEAKLYAKEKGMLIEEGILVGVGETLQDIADSLVEMGRIQASQVRVMSFVPQKGTPMENVLFSNRDLEMKVIAVMRLLYPFALIPASLDIDGINGLKIRLDAGANVVTSIIPPHKGLMGVAQNTKNIDDGCRTADEVRSVLSEMGLRAATSGEYADYISKLMVRGN